MARLAGLLVVLALAAAVALTPVDAKRKTDPKECEVCISVVKGIKEIVGDQHKDSAVVEDAIATYCKRSDIKPKEKKACYFLTDVKRDVATVIGLGAPDDRVCKKLKKKNFELCELRFPLKVDKDTDYSKLRVKELRKILDNRGVGCDGCLEKGDYVRKCQETEHMEL
mmetsp:Transcript_1128/g.3192  ORF Transcript_1128/g.3192 Transcript_1128/m.3192 type:complete len:168 (+) Transcript_1128:173-676(+)